MRCHPTLVDAKYTCGASRPRLFWTDFEIVPLEGETHTRGASHNELKMIEDPDRSKFWDAGWTAHPRFQLPYPCICGWERRSKPRPDPRGFYDASREALSRWEQDHWAGGIRFYEDTARAWKQDQSESRTISPSECERLLGFPVSWTNPGSTDSSEDTPYQRRNAIGNAFSVPVTTRLLFALALSLSVPEAGAFPQWSDPNLAAPYHHDCLDDILPQVSCISQGYSELTCEFDDYMPRSGPIALSAPIQGQEAGRIVRRGQPVQVCRWVPTFPGTVSPF